MLIRPQHHGATCGHGRSVLHVPLHLLIQFHTIDHALPTTGFPCSARGSARCTVRLYRAGVLDIVLFPFALRPVKNHSGLLFKDMPSLRQNRTVR